MSSVLAYETLVEDTVRVMIDQLDKRFASTGQPCDLSSWLQFYAFDVISAATFSSRVGFIDNGEDVGGVMEGIWSRFKYFATVQSPLVMPALENHKNNKNCGKADYVEHRSGKCHGLISFGIKVP